MAQNKSLSTQEVAAILHVSKSTIYDLIKKGEIHSYKIGRKVRFTQDDVDAYIARSRHEHSTRPVKNIDTYSTAGTNYEMDAISACVVGGVSASGGAGTVLGMVIGATLIGVINLGMSLISLDANYQRVVKGFVLLAAVVFDILSKKKQK